MDHIRDLGAANAQILVILCSPSLPAVHSSLKDGILIDEKIALSPPSHAARLVLVQEALEQLGVSFSGSLAPIAAATQGYLPGNIHTVTLRAVYRAETRVAEQTGSGGSAATLTVLKEDFEAALVSAEDQGGRPFLGQQQARRSSDLLCSLNMTWSGLLDTLASPSKASYVPPCLEGMTTESGTSGVGWADIGGLAKAKKVERSASFCQDLKGRGSNLIRGSP